MNAFAIGADEDFVATSLVSLIFAAAFIGLLRNLSFIAAKGPRILSLRVSTVSSDLISW